MWPGSRLMGKEGTPESAKSPALAPPMATLTIFRLHWPLLEIGNGCRVVQAPTVWMTSGAKARSGGTSMAGHGVLAVTVRLMTGLSGSSLTMRRLQVFAPHEVGVKRMTASRHESGLTTAGNGLLTSVKSWQGGWNITLVTSNW